MVDVSIGALEFDVALPVFMVLVAVWMYETQRAWAILRNALSSRVQAGNPDEWIEGIPVYDFDAPDWLGRFWLIERHNLDGMMVSIHDGFILLHGDRYQPAAMCLNRRLRKNPALRARQIQHELGHGKIARAGGRHQAIRNMLWDYKDSYATNWFAFRHPYPKEPPT